MRLAISLPLVLATTLGIAAPAQADVYRWVDAQGTIHFAQDHGQVSAAYRAQLRTVRPGTPTPTVETPAVGGRYQVRYESENHLIRVTVRLNDRVSAPFYVDTGSTALVIPAAVAERLGVDPRSTGTAMLRTAMGPVEVQTLRLDSVRLGPAEVSGVSAAVAPGLEIGLLGGEFLNHFSYTVDPETQTLTLIPRETGAAE